MAIEPEQIRIDYIEEDLLRQRNIRLGILRLDELHPLVSGNKWFKLKENIAAARERGAAALLTFGGAFSNHLLATAAAAKACGFGSVGMVRGLHGQQQRSATLEQCCTLGMELHFLDRETYRNKTDILWLASLQQQFPGAYLIPEGGDNDLGFKGAAEIADHIPADTSLVALALGTGTTFAGVRSRLNPAIPMLGFPVMKGGEYLAPSVKEKVPPYDNWQLDADYHFGGFARYSSDLLHFMNIFYEQHGIPLDFVYTGKMMYGIYDKIAKGIIAPGSHVLCLHTGGLQGNSSISHLLLY